MTHMFCRGGLRRRPVGLEHRERDGHVLHVLRRDGLNGDVAAWNTDTASVTSMRSMFTGATAFCRDLSSWNVLQVGFSVCMFTFPSIAHAARCSPWPRGPWGDAVSEPCECGITVAPGASSLTASPSPSPPTPSYPPDRSRLVLRERRRQRGWLGRASRHHRGARSRPRRRLCGGSPEAAAGRQGRVVPPNSSNNKPDVCWPDRAADVHQRAQGDRGITGQAHPPFRGMGRWLTLACRVSVEGSSSRV